MAEEKNSLNVRDFSKVILTLENVLVPSDKLSPTPSFSDGLDSETEMDLRILGCELIQTAGILLKLPQVAMASGQVLFQRFYYSKSFVKHNMEVVAMACINLASKIEEAPRRIRDVVNVFHHVKQVRNGKNIGPLILDQSYINLKNQVIKAERRILKELGFCVHVKHPHKIIVMYLQVLGCEKNSALVQCAWNYMNDSFRTDVFVRCHPEAIACSCIYMAARQLQIPLPDSPSWYGCFGVTEEDIKDICLTILQLYARRKPNPEKLEAVVNDARKLHVEAKLKAKGLTSSDVGTPNSTSRAASPAIKLSISPINIPGMRRMKSEDEGSGNSGSNNYGNHLSKKKRHSRSRSRSHSKSRSYPSSRGSRSPSRSTSRSPKRKYRSPGRKYKKESHISRSHSKDHYVKEKHHKRRHSPSYARSRSRSFSRSPERSRVHKKYHKEKVKYRSRSKSRERTYKSKKHSNGHNRSRSRDRYRR